MVGDVAGKGVHAAVVTSMARYTVRTLSAQGWSPGRVLEQLNQALLADVDEERFCTVLYGRIAQDSVDIDAELDARGPRHPRARRPPAAARAVAGRVGDRRRAARHSARPAQPGRHQGGDDPAAAGGGARRLHGRGHRGAGGVEQFGEQRLADMVAAAAGGLRGAIGPAAAALVADAVADRVLAAVTEFPSERDDVAVLVVVAE